MIAEIFHWMEVNRDWLSWLGIASFTMVILSLIVVPLLVIRMQEDYFLENRNPRKSLKKQHPVLRMTGLIAKNLTGGLLVISGVLLSLPLVPGQGLLTVLIGLAIMDFPGKRRLEIWLVKRKPVAWAIRKLREKANRPPLFLPVDR